MRLTVGELAPVPADPRANAARIAEVVAAAPADLALFPELFLSGYRIGDRMRSVALDPAGSDPVSRSLSDLARRHRTAIAVGAPVASPERPGELENAIVVALADGTIARQPKRYLPSFGPFEEGLAFSPSDASRPIAVGAVRVGFEICYDVFFPEVTRALALAGAHLLVNLSASPVTSRALFDRLLPARAIENGGPVVYVNRVGVEDGIVFGGGSGAWDGRGEPIAGIDVAGVALGPEERVVRIEIDPEAVARWRPFRPVLRDVAARPGPQ